MPAEEHRSGSGQHPDQRPGADATDDEVVKDDAYYAEVRGALGRGTPSVLFGTSNRSIARAINRAQQGNGRLPPPRSRRNRGRRRPTRELEERIKQTELLAQMLLARMSPDEATAVLKRLDVPSDREDGR